MKEQIVRFPPIFITYSWCSYSNTQTLLEIDATYCSFYSSIIFAKNIIVLPFRQAIFLLWYNEMVLHGALHCAGFPGVSVTADKTCLFFM